MTTLFPPTMGELLRLPAYRRMMTRIPRLEDNYGKLPGTWRLILHLDTGVWKGVNYDTYSEAWDALRSRISHSRVEDIALISRRKVFPLPNEMKTSGPLWDPALTWCGRCRRPSTFPVTLGHRNVPNLLSGTATPAKRCYYCGVKETYLLGIRGVE